MAGSAPSKTPVQTTLASFQRAISNFSTEPTVSPPSLKGFLLMALILHRQNQVAKLIRKMPQTSYQTYHWQITEKTSLKQPLQPAQLPQPLLKRLRLRRLLPQGKSKKCLLLHRPLLKIATRLAKWTVMRTEFAWLNQRQHNSLKYLTPLLPSLILTPKTRSLMKRRKKRILLIC